MKGIFSGVLVLLLCSCVINLCHAWQLETEPSAPSPSLIMSLVGRDKFDNPVVGAAATCVDSNCSTIICKIRAVTNVTQVVAVPSLCQNCDRIPDGDDIDMFYVIKAHCVANNIQWCTMGGCPRSFCKDCNWWYKNTLQSIVIEDAYCFHN